MLRSSLFLLSALMVIPGVAATHLTGNFSCARQEAPTPPMLGGTPKSEPAAEPKPETAKAEPEAPAPAPAPAPEPTPRERLRTWLTANLPDGGAIVEDGPALAVEHTTRKGDTVQKIADAYLPLTTVYGEGDLVGAMLKANPKLRYGVLDSGLVVRIPHVIDTAPPNDDRLGWPKDDAGALRGIYVNATMAGQPGFPAMLDKMVARGMNAIVVDVKDVTGFFTYPSKIPLAIEVGANKHTTVPSFPHFVRYVHGKGLRVIARVTCFRDEYVGPRKTELAVQKKGGGPHVAPSKVIDWLDPQNEKVQGYLTDVVDEALSAGVDEIQLDYVRYPTDGAWDADFHLKEKNLSSADVITGFVKKVHEHTSKVGATLSLDVFGVVAWRDKRDIDATGQDLRRLAPFIDAVSPMVYPSHFADGFNGYAHPGDHADVVAIGTKRALQEIEAVGAKVAVRPWVQAFPWHTSVFGSAYVADQIKEAKSGGGVGWLAWNSGGEYGATFAAVPPKKSDLATK